MTDGSLLNNSADIDEEVAITPGLIGASDLAITTSASIQNQTSTTSNLLAI